MKLTIQGIVFNAETVIGEKMLMEWLRFIYMIGDEIIIAEGAARGSCEGEISWATENGKSTDNTLEIIRSFPDPEGKIKIVEFDGFWPSKTRMFQTCNKYTTGDYILVSGSDEFYDIDSFRKFMILLDRLRPDVVYFYFRHFWGDFFHCVDIDDKLWANIVPIARIFKFTNGSRWVEHRPPIFLYPNGLLSSNSNRIITREQTLDMNLSVFHYSYVYESQVAFKSKYYRLNYNDFWSKWKKDCNISLINGSRTVEYKGKHPIDVSRLI